MVGINANIPLVAEDAIDTVFVELIAIGGFDMVCVEVSDNDENQSTHRSKGLR